RSLTEECKHLRQELASWHDSQLRQARDTPGDVGTTLSHPQEQERSDIKHLLQANFCRIQEALRVLEEYGKLYKIEMGLACKQMRYRVYALESNLLSDRTVAGRYAERNCPIQKLKNSLLYLVTSPSDRLLETVEASLKAGLTLVQYREKNADDTIRLELASKLCQLCHQYDALFIVNDRADIALAVNADGVHLGQQDISVALARQILGKNRIVGRSTTNPEEMAGAIAEGADYIGVGPVYATPTKAGKAPAGLEYVRYASANCPIPWYAIGGINENNLAEVVDAGAERVSVVRAIVESECPDLITQKLLLQLNDRKICVDRQLNLDK
ncbi:MAG: thiamine phosphate synthase, partial [Xenococcaceae cyanobacterium]